MLLLHASNLLAEAFIYRRIGIRGGCRRVTVVDRVNPEEQIVLREIRVDARGAKVLPHMLRRIGVRDRHALAKIHRALRPQSQQRLHTRYRSSANRIIRYKCHIAKPQVLTVPFIVAKNEKLVTPDRPSERGAKIISLKWRNLRLIEVVARIEGAVAKELIHRAMK